MLPPPPHPSHGCARSSSGLQLGITCGQSRRRIFSILGADHVLCDCRGTPFGGMHASASYGCVMCSAPKSSSTRQSLPMRPHAWWTVPRHTSRNAPLAAGAALPRSKLAKCVPRCTHTCCNPCGGTVMLVGLMGGALNSGTASFGNGHPRLHERPTSHSPSTGVRSE